MSSSSARPHSDYSPAPSSPPGAHRRLLLVDDDPLTVQSMAQIFEAEGFEVFTASSSEEAMQVFQENPAHVVIADLVMPGKSGIELTRQVKELSPGTSVVVITGHASTRAAVGALKSGAADFLPKPVEPDTLRLVVSELSRDLPKHLFLRSQPGSDDEVMHFDGFVARSKAMKQVFTQLQVAAQTETTVLICGESGTGKELAAASIHRRSARSSGPFIAVHTGAIPQELVASELFGHEKGAFTGATETRSGHFEAAARGSLFLDEVNTMDARTQVSLLRVLESFRYSRVGSQNERVADVRVIAASNRDLSELVKAGQFRQDLFYRLNVFPIMLPPLRDRREDIPVLAQSFVDAFTRRYRKQVRHLSAETLDLLERYPWPGNARELRNVIEHMVILANGERLTPDLLPRLVAGSVNDSDYLRIPVGTQMKDIERTVIARTLDANDWNKQQVARILGISRRSLYNKLDRYQITRGPR